MGGASVQSLDGYSKYACTQPEHICRLGAIRVVSVSLFGGRLCKSRPRIIGNGTLHEFNDLHSLWPTVLHLVHMEQTRPLFN